MTKTAGKSFCTKNTDSFNRINCVAVYKQASKDFRTERREMLKLVVCIIVLAAVCCAQEHLTCLRTDGVLNQQNPQTNQRASQGPPGKRGAKGPIGSRGRRGQKGEPGIPDDQQINLLRSKFNTLLQEVEALRNQSRENQQFLSAFSKGLYIPPHFYIYQLTPNTHSWEETQNYCQNWGGALAMHGVKTIENRKKLIENLRKIHPSLHLEFWIGAKTNASDGNWIWLKGERASSSELIWRRGRENAFSRDFNNICVVVDGITHSYVGLAQGLPCSDFKRWGLCEKQL